MTRSNRTYVKEPLNNVVPTGGRLPLFDDAIVVHFNNTIQINLHFLDEQAKTVDEWVKTVDE